MSWRIRKFFNFGPLRLNTSNSGLGWSIGLAGFRYGRNSYNRPYISFGLGPLRFFKYLGKSKPYSQKVIEAKNSAQSIKKEDGLHKSDVTGNLTENQKIIRELNNKL